MEAWNIRQARSRGGIPEDKTYDVILLAVAHNEFLSLDFNKIKNENTVIFDAKAILNRDIVDSRL